MRFVLGIDIGGTNLVVGSVAEDGSALLALFGPTQRLEIEAGAAFDGKCVQYTSDLDPDAA